VFLIEALHGIMPNEDPDASEIVRRSMIDRDGVKLMCCGKDLKISKACRRWQEALGRVP
jgi:pyruvate/2-oxoglutarate dehydrogenase complex dihydrolipoamide dehydrogenase (E3) component